jgi:hypothetical protein
MRMFSLRVNGSYTADPTSPASKAVEGLPPPIYPFSSTPFWAILAISI